MKRLITKLKNNKSTGKQSASDEHGREDTLVLRSRIKEKLANPRNRNVR